MSSVGVGTQNFGVPQLVHTRVLLQLAESKAENKSLKERLAQSERRIGRLEKTVERRDARFHELTVSYSVVLSTMRALEVYEQKLCRFTSEVLAFWGFGEKHVVTRAFKNTTGINSPSTSHKKALLNACADFNEKITPKYLIRRKRREVALELKPYVRSPVSYTSGRRRMDGKKSGHGKKEEVCKTGRSKKIVSSSSSSTMSRTAAPRSKRKRSQLKREGSNKEEHSSTEADRTHRPKRSTTSSKRMAPVCRRNFAIRAGPETSSSGSSSSCNVPLPRKRRRTRLRSAATITTAVSAESSDDGGVELCSESD